jgi:hypothetical protein
MKLLIVVHHRLDLWQVPPWFGPRLKEQFPQLEVKLRENYVGVENDLHDAEILFTAKPRDTDLPGVLKF